MAGSDWGRPGCFRSGRTCAVLKSCGNVPSEKDKLASLTINGVKISRHEHSNDVGRTSIGDDLGKMDRMSLSTSVTVRGTKELNCEPTCARVGNRGMGKPANCTKILLLSLANFCGIVQ